MLFLYILILYITLSSSFKKYESKSTRISIKYRSVKRCKAAFCNKPLQPSLAECNERNICNDEHKDYDSELCKLCEEYYDRRPPNCNARGCGNNVKSIGSFVSKPSKAPKPPKAPGNNCGGPCPKNKNPVCGSDGNTYGNVCSFIRAKCSNKNLKVVNCKKS